MASGLSVYLANKVLDKIMGGVDWTPTTSYWVAAFNASNSATYLRSNTLGSASEVAGNNYSRVQVRAGSSVAWGTAAAGHTENDTDISFPQASGSWGTIYACALMDASTAGNVVAYGDLVTPKPVTSPDIFKIPATFFGVNL